MMEKFYRFTCIVLLVYIAFASVLVGVDIRVLEQKYNETERRLHKAELEIASCKNRIADLLTQIDNENEEEKEPEINYDYTYVLRVVAAESRGESLEGQMAVAQCIRNTSELYGITPEEVVKEPKQYTAPVSIEYVTDSVREACERVFLLGESVTDEPIRYFYSTRDGRVSQWHENNLEYVMTIGIHKFFKTK